METCETVEIKTKDGIAIINKEDFDPKTMKKAPVRRAKKAAGE